MAKGCYQYPVQKWTPEINQFLLEHKLLPREELYALLLKEYPNIDTTLTYGFCKTYPENKARSVHWYIILFIKKKTTLPCSLF